MGYEVEMQHCKDSAGGFTGGKDGVGKKTDMAKVSRGCACFITFPYAKNRRI